MGEVGEFAGLDALIADLTRDAYGDDEQLAASLLGAEEALAAPQVATVVGARVHVATVLDGPDEPRGLEGLSARRRGVPRVVCR